MFTLVAHGQISTEACKVVPSSYAQRLFHSKCPEAFPFLLVLANGGLLQNTTEGNTQPPLL